MEIDEDFLVISVNPTNFPGKLWNLVNDPQISSVCWDASGEGILIHQQSFEAEVLLSHTKQIQKYFKTADFSSFIRQLNLYGFRKVRTDHDVLEMKHESSSMSQLHHFHNPNFKQDKAELLVNLKRLTPVNRAKLASGMELTRRTTKHYNHAMLNSPQENSAGIKNGSVLVERQGTPYHHHYNDPQQGKAWDESPRSSHAFVMGHGDASVTLYTNKAVPVSLFHHFSMDSSPAQGAIPHHSQYGFYTPVFPCYSPGYLDSKMLHSQQPAASYSHYGYYPGCSAGYLPPTDQGRDWRAGNAPDSRMSDMNLDTVFNVAEERQLMTEQNRKFVEIVGLPSGATETHSPYQQEIAGSNPGDATAIRGQKLQRAKLDCALTEAFHSLSVLEEIKS